MQPNPKFGKLASESQVQKTIQALKKNGFNALLTKTGEQAKEKVLELIPQGTQVMTMSSQTTESISLAKDINETGKYNSMRNKLMAMDMKTQADEMRKLAAAPDWTVGSTHAVTESGEVLIASNTGSQLAAYVYTAGKVIWVVGTQKIVKDIDEGMKRIYEYSLPLEDARARKAYGMPSAVNKILTVNKEVTPGRITVILVKEKLGF